METSTRIQLVKAPCPKCGKEVRLPARTLIGEVFDCKSCQGQLEVASLHPLFLEPLAKIEEDEEDFRSGRA